MQRLRLIHWKKSEAAGYFARLREAGYRVDYDEQFRPQLMKLWRQSPPDGFVIDLSRLPSHGREIAIALRQNSVTRSVPLVFCGGNPDKVNALRAILPDARYCEFPKLLSTLKMALNAPLQNPVRPTAMMDRYKSRSAAEKLGIKPGIFVALLNAPRDHERFLSPLPDNVTVLEVETMQPSARVHICFVHRQHELPPLLSHLRGAAATGKLWIAWRKGGKAAAGEVTENLVRQHALELGLVDYKVCSVNEVWSALLFALKQ